MRKRKRKEERKRQSEKRMKEREGERDRESEKCGIVGNFTSQHEVINLTSENFRLHYTLLPYIYLFVRFLVGFVTPPKGGENRKTSESINSMTTRNLHSIFQNKQISKSSYVVYK